MARIYTQLAHINWARNSRGPDLSTQIAFNGALAARYLWLNALAYRLGTWRTTEMPWVASSVSHALFGRKHRMRNEFNIKLVLQLHPLSGDLLFNKYFGRLAEAGWSQLTVEDLVRHVDAA